MSQEKLTPCPSKKSGFNPPPPPPLVTYRILAEDGAILNTESGQKMRTEQKQ